MSKCTSWWIQDEYAFFTYSTQEEALRVCESVATWSWNKYDVNPLVVETPVERRIGNDRYAVRVKVHAAVDYFRNNVID